MVLAGYRDGRRSYNAPVVPGGDGRVIRVDKPGRVVFHASVGPSAGEFVVQVVDNPYVVRASRDGAFAIADLPAGAVRLSALAAGAGGE